jgi:phosphoribulokinase
MNLDNFFKGWLVGDFAPALFNSKDVEVGVKYYNKGDFEFSHVHKIITEYTIVLSGKVKMLDQIYEKGSIVKVEPGIYTSFECLEDAITLVIKNPSIPSDKHSL